MNANAPLPDATVIAIYFAPGPHKNIAVDFGVSITTVSSIKTGARRSDVIERYMADCVRASAAALTTKAFYPQLLVQWS